LRGLFTGGNLRDGYVPLGIAEIDKGHEEILSIISELNKLINNRSEDKAIIKYLDLLLKTLEVHNALEQNLMNENNLNDPEHTLEHQRFMLELDSNRQQLEFELKRFQVLWNDSIQTLLLRDFTILDGKLAQALKPN
jgi:hemerythrin-like metal-binding protein